MKKWLKRTGIFLLLLVLLLVAAGLYLFKVYLPGSAAQSAFPQTTGEMHLSGLDKGADVYRDKMGIPHIYASTQQDLFFAQGFVHAQERFWQMDVWRHVGSGRLAEMFGKSQLKTDAFLRTLGWREVAEQEWNQLSPRVHGMLDAYAAGVNAYLRGRKASEVSLEYTVLGVLSPDYTIAPWEPVHTLTWGKAMAWDLRSNMQAELARAALMRVLPAQQVDQLYPPYPKDHPNIVASPAGAVQQSMQDGQIPPEMPVPAVGGWLSAVERNLSVLPEILGPAERGIGSNSWVIGGELSATGKPFLANDPHLGVQMPSIWFQSSLHCLPKTDQCSTDVSGFSFAGVPGVVIGHNDRIAWGFTNNGADVMDMFIEKVNPDNPAQYEADGRWVDFETREISLAVAGEEPQKLTVRHTRHGPVISDTFGALSSLPAPDATEQAAFQAQYGQALPEKYVVSLAWTALQPASPLEAVWLFNSARDWESFRHAARSFSVPSQNLVYADVDGNIGYQMPGRVPLRKRGDGSLPVPGWTGEYDWSGYIPFEELPSVLNPPEGFIVTANNRVVDERYQHFLSSDWDYGYRAQRIVDLIKQAPGKINQEYLQQMQADAYDGNAVTLVPLLTRLKGVSEANQQAALKLLSEWDYQSAADSPAAAVFSTIWRNLAIKTFGDQLVDNWHPGGARWFEIMRHLTPDIDSDWWDDKATANVVETRDDMLKQALIAGVAELEKLQGKDPAQWRWGDLHQATFRNGTLGQSGIPPLEALFNRGGYATGGNISAVNATGWSLAAGYEVNWLPSMRMVIDLSDLKQSVSVHTTGQSGHAYHPHYDDMAPLWAQNQYYPMLWDEASVRAGAAEHLQLLPAK